MHASAAANRTLPGAEPTALDWACAAAGVFLLSNLLMFLLVGLEQDSVLFAAANVEQYRTKQGVFGAVYLLSGLLLAMRRDAYRWEVVGAPLLVLMALPALSALWSPDPGLTLRRTLSLWGTTVYGIYLGVVFTDVQMRRLLILSALLGAAASGLLIAFTEDSGRMEYGVVGWVWQGVYSHKNVLAQNMALGMLCLLVPVPDRQLTPLRVLGRAAMLGVMALFLFKAYSATSWVVLATALGVGWLLPPNGAPAHRWFLFWVLAFTIAVIGPVLLSIDPVGIMGALGRDASLTNRVPLWQFVIDRIWDEPLLGWGYGTFFSGMDSPAAEHWAVSKLFEIHSHNGFLQLALDSGLAGVGALLVLLAGYVRILRRTGEWAWHVVLLVFILGHNVAEVSLVSPHALLWALFLAARTRAVLSQREASPW